MGSLRVFVLCVLFCLSVRVSSDIIDDSQVVEESSVTIESVLDEYGEWETAVSTILDPSISPNNTNIDVKRSVLDKGGKKMVVIKITMKGLSSQGHSTAQLRFHRTGAKNIVVKKEGTVAVKINELTEEGYGGLLTNRPLKNNEMFEVKIDKLIDHYKTSLGVGISYHNLRNTDYGDWMKCGTKMLYNNQLYEAGTVTKRNIGPNLRNLKVGDRVGVVKMRNGDLHFLVNGMDLGAVVSGIDYPVYGVVDLFGNAVQVSLVHHKSVLDLGP